MDHALPPTFDGLGPGTRLWLLATDGDPSPLLPDVRAFCHTWTSHGRRVHATADVLAGRVLAVAAVISEAEMNGGVSGCGIDAMQHAVEEAAARHGLGLTSPLSVTYRDAAGAWQSVPRSAFRALLARGAAGPETPVLDLTPTTLGALDAGVERLAGETWHAAAFNLDAPHTA
ncbi:MAG TPA: hypothetical protein VGB53_11650 [Rubricoccaceae bacterium]|jgi:hypothetical protein